MLCISRVKKKKKQAFEEVVGDKLDAKYFVLRGWPKLEGGKK